MKICLVGDSCSGKTSLIERLKNNTFSEKYKKSHYSCETLIDEFIFNDIPGHYNKEKIELCSKNTDLILMIVDLKKINDSYYSRIKWHIECFDEDVKFVLVGNYYDTDSRVNIFNKISKKINVTNFIISCKTGDGFEELNHYILQKNYSK